MKKAHDAIFQELDFFDQRLRALRAELDEIEVKRIALQKAAGDLRLLKRSDILNTQKEEKHEMIDALAILLDTRECHPPPKVSARWRRPPYLPELGRRLRNPTRNMPDRPHRRACAD